MNTRLLSQKHIEQLYKESGINEKTAIEAGIVSLDDKEAKELLGIGGSGIAFPYYDTHENFLGYRIKQDNPIIGESGKRAKYLTEKDSNAFIFFIRPELPNILTSDKVIITEGEKKCTKLHQEQIASKYTIPVIAMAGCWMFRKKEMGENELHPVLEDIIKNKKEVIIIPDSDYFKNHKVNSAYNKLAYILFHRGIKVSIVDIRIRGFGEKLGVDDFLMLESFEQLEEKIHTPIVTFQNLSLDEISSRIKTKGISSETLEEIFSSLAFFDKFQIAEAINSIKTHSKIKQKDLMSLFCKVKSQFSFFHNEESPESYVRWNNQEEGHDVLFKRIGKILSTQGQAYLSALEPHKLISTNEDFSKITIADSKEKLYDLLGTMLVIEHVRSTDQGEITIGTEPLSRNLISIFSSSIDKYVMCPLVSIISHTPLFIPGKNKIINEMGYHKVERAILTNSFNIKRENHSRIKFLLENTPFRSDIDMENFLAVLITAVLIKKSLPGAFPSLLIRAQEHGSGKSQLASCLQYLSEGKNYGMITYKNDTELEKHLAAQIENSCIIIDNLRQSNLDSTLLEKFMTDPVISYRRLGTQEEIKKINDTMVIFTMNGGGMTSDLTSRCLVIELDKENQKKSQGFNPLDFVREYRNEIIEEVLGLLNNSDLFRQIDVNRTRFPRWEGILRNIMHGNGYKLFLTNIDEMHESIDQNLACILNVVIKNHDYFTKPMSARDILNIMESKKSFNEQVNLSPQKIGKLLSSKVGRKINFMAFDNLRYEFFIIKSSNSFLGGDNHTYKFEFNLLKPVGSVALVNESNMCEQNIVRKSFPNYHLDNNKTSHEATLNF